MNSRIIVIMLVLVGGTVLAQEDSLKRLYLANDTHTDLMWNGDEEQWTRWTIEMADFYLLFTERTAEKPLDQRVKWNYDMAWNLYVMEEHTEPEFFNRIIEQLRNQQASVPYNFTLATYGGFTPETVLRRFYYGGYLERKYGFDIELGSAIESSVIPLGLASLWAGSGAKYSWKGICNCATKINARGDRDHEIYWYTGLDGSRTLMKWYSMYGPNDQLGGYSETLDPRLAIKQMDALCGSDRYPYHIAGAFSKGWDNGRNFSLDFHALMKGRQLPGTKAIVSNQVDFFRDFESVYGDVLPSETLAYGNEWDLYPASLPAATAQMRRSMEKLRTAEAMAAIADRDRPGRYGDLEPLKKEFYYGLSVYGLHGWTADGPWVSRDEFADWARLQQGRVTRYVDALFDRGMADLGGMIKARKPDHRYFVFNSLNQQRGGLVQVNDLPDGPGLMKNVATGSKHPVFTLDNPGAEPSSCFVADDVPGAGYQVYEWVADKGTRNTGELPFSVSGSVIETPFYTLNVRPDGVITSLVEKETGKEWVTTVLNHLNTWVMDDRELADSNASDDPGGSMTVEMQNGEFLTLVCSSESPVKHVTRIRLHARDPRIDISNTIWENFADPLYCTFDLKVDLPEVWHEEVGAVIRAKLHSNGGHYAESKARYDHLSFNHFAWVGNQESGMVISNSDCSFFRRGESEPGYLDEHSSTIHALVGGMVDLKRGIYKQGGDSLFRVNFSIVPMQGAFNQTAAMQFALEHQNPLVAGKVTGDKDAPLPEKKYSLLATSDPDILLWTLKPGEDGGTVLRFWNMDSASEPLFSLDRLPARVHEATHVETLLDPVRVSGKGFKGAFRQQQMCTYHLQW